MQIISSPGDHEVYGTLLAPVNLGRFTLSHRVVLAPMTRCRALNHIPQKAHVEYYFQRTTPSGLLITEAVAICSEGIGFPHSPGIYNAEQVEAWRAVVEAVHSKGGIIFCQLWHVGRASHTTYQPNGKAPVSSTNDEVPTPWMIRMPDNQAPLPYSRPRALSKPEIATLVQQFRQAARSAVDAGFDGVEIHAAHGYLIDQFFKDGINDRKDEYGGSVEGRCRFGREVVEAVVEEVGAERVGVRVSPIVQHLGATDSDPMALGLHIVAHLNRLHVAYMHITEPCFTSQGVVSTEDTSLPFARAFEGVVMSSGGHTRESGMRAIGLGHASLIGYGRLFISNPDLPLRLALDAPLAPYDRTTFYTHHQTKGFTDYPPLLLRHHHCRHPHDDEDSPLASGHPESRVSNKQHLSNLPSFGRLSSQASLRTPPVIGTP